MKGVKANFSSHVSNSCLTNHRTYLQCWVPQILNLADFSESAFILFRAKPCVLITPPKLALYSVLTKSSFPKFTAQRVLKISRLMRTTYSSPAHVPHGSLFLLLHLTDVTEVKGDCIHGCTQKTNTVLLNLLDTWVFCF